MRVNFDRVGTAGMFITALASPCCFPLFGFVLTALGFGSFELFGGWTMWVFQGMVLFSLAGFVLSYRKHRCMYPLLIAVPATLLIFYAYHLDDSERWTTLLYAGMFGLLAATLINWYRIRRHKRNHPQSEMQLQSIITCPSCGHQKEETMPTDACQYFYECEHCRTGLKPKSGDCCVYCSYGTVKCPPIQLGLACC